MKRLTLSRDLPCGAALGHIATATTLFACFSGGRQCDPIHSVVVLSAQQLSPFRPHLTLALGGALLVHVDGFGYDRDIDGELGSLLSPWPLHFILLVTPSKWHNPAMLGTVEACGIQTSRDTRACYDL